jgi:hypothetical protein
MRNLEGLVRPQIHIPGLLILGLPALQLHTCFPAKTASQGLAGLLERISTGCPVNGPIHPAPTRQMGIGGVYHCTHGALGQVGIQNSKVVREGHAGSPRTKEVIVFL